MVKVGIIGGSGLDDPDILKNAEDLEVSTPYGEPSSPMKAGELGGVEVLLLARHGRRHTIPPTRVNNRANVHALKEAGATHVLATTAVGSLREEIDRGHFVVLDQFIDFTRRRPLTFFDEFPPDEPKHTSMAEPFDAGLRGLLLEGCRELDIPHHRSGTVVTIEGPRFSTRAESFMFRKWGADVINMTTAPEAALANEAGLPYAAVAISTDYDCWREGEEPVTWQEVLAEFEKNVEKVKGLLVRAVPGVARL